MKFSDLFSKRLYKEGLNRVKGFGIVAVVWTTLSNLSSPLALLFAYLLSDGSESQVIMPGSMVSHLNILLLFAPLIIGQSFRFLNKRNTCDFYHALPYKRITIYSSFFLGAMTWLAAAAVIPFLVALLLYVVFPFTTVVVGYSLLGLLAFLVCMLFMSGAAALAMSMTGTRFSNFAVFCILLLEIPLLAAVFSFAVRYAVPVYDLSQTAFVYLTFDKALPLLMLRSGTNTVTYDGWAVALYAVAAVACIVLGGLAFVRRRGEMAGTAARPVWQSVWRNSVAAPVFLFGVAIVLDAFLPGVNAQSRISSVVVMIGCFCAALGAVILYELLSTSNLRGIGRVLRHYLWLFAAGAVVIVAVFGIRIGVLARRLGEDDIASVRFSTADAGVLDYFNKTTYEDLATADAYYTDRDMIGMIHDCYTESIEACRRGEFQEEGAVNGASHDYYMPIYVTVKTKRGGTFTRALRIPTAKYQTLLDRKMNSETYMETVTTLPPSSSFMSITTNCAADRAGEIWKLFCEEYEAMSETEKADYKAGVRNMIGEWAFYFDITGVLHGEYYVNTYPIPASFEKTIAALVTAANSESENGKTDLEYIKDCLADAVSNGTADMDIAATLYDADGNSTGNLVAYLDEGETISDERKAAFAAIRSAIDASDGTYSAGTPFLVIYLDTNEYNGRTCIVLLDADTYASLLAALKSANGRPATGVIA